MESKAKLPLEDRVARTADAVLAARRFVSSIDIFTELGLLAPSHLREWRSRRVAALEDVIQGHPDRVARVLVLMREWALKCGLHPIVAPFFAQTVGPQRELRFSKSGNPEVENLYRTLYILPDISEKRRQQLVEKLTRPEIVVFSVRKDSQCARCGTDLPHGSFLALESGQAWCLTCAGLDHLTYVPAGDSVLSRRARQYSPISAVVVRWSRTRKQYEREGLLVEPTALEKARSELTQAGVDQ